MSVKLTGRRELAGLLDRKVRQNPEKPAGLPVNYPVNYSPRW